MSTAASLDLIERCYDAIPRVAATTEEVGPFTLFLAEPGTGWDFYARPRLGVDDITADDVRRVLARQHSSGVVRAIEWVHEVTPSLLPAVRSAVPQARLEECPLLALEGPPLGEDPPGRVAVLAADSPDLPLAVGAVAAAFGGTDEMTAGDLGRRGELVSAGSDDAASVYRAVGFARLGTAYILELPDE